MKGKIPCYADVGLCEEWADDFVAFKEHIGPAPSEDHTIDRIDPFRGYEPGNVRWATRKEQNRNRRRHVYVRYESAVVPLSVACEAVGAEYHVEHARLKNGKSRFEAVA
jgi:hypothetical protein